VVGFDDIEDSAYSTPSLTTISPGRDAIARTAVDLLVDRMDGLATRSTPRQVEIGFTLVVRESSVDTEAI